MTLLLRRKRPTTARRITPATLAANLVAVAALLATPALAQQPGYQPVQPGYQLAQPPGYQPAQPGGQQPGMLPLPPGYRPRTPPPQYQQQQYQQPQSQSSRQPAAPVSGVGGTGNVGKIMYFQKPADALTASGTETETDAVAAPVPVTTTRPPVRTEEVAQWSGIGRAPAPVAEPRGTELRGTEVAAAEPGFLPPPPPPVSRYLPPDAPGANPLASPDRVAVATPAAFLPQPEKPDEPKGEPKPAGEPRPPEPSTSTSGKQPIPKVDPKYIRLPSRENIFMVYNDPELEKAIMERLRQDLREQKKYTPDQEQYLVFPPLPLINPPGVAYRPKTLSYAPSQVVLEPGYVIHRRLHFEEKNGERAAWDLGPLSVLVGAGYFYRDVLLWPQSLASGCVTGFWSTSAGKCLPGSPSPYYFYPLGITASGSFAELAVLAGVSAVLP
jgi:hypothetical protein